MPGSAWLDITGIKGRIREGERAALEEIGDRLAADARRRAPIRKVFKERKGYRRRFRRLTPLEQRIAIARANAYYGPAEFKRRWQSMSTAQQSRARFHYSHAELARRGSLNALSRSNKLRTLGYERQGKFVGAQPGVVRLVGRGRRGFEPGQALSQLLTSRGRYEIQSGRAIHREATASGHTRVRVGGALKASIGNEGVVETSTGLKVVVAALIRYAKFVEFPTIRTSAQPFMRPALHAMRDAIPRIIGAHINRALRG